MIHNTLLSFLDKNQEGKIIKINLDEITMHPELKDAFHIDAEVKDRIKSDMAANGFSKGHPIHIFRWEEKWILCDGHTRYTAAKELGLKTIWAQIHQFDSINQALLYSMKEQFNRRNIEDSELFKQFEVLRQEEFEGRKLTAAELSERLNKSKRHIFKLQEVFAKSSKEQLKEIRDGKASINKIYNDIKKQENLDEENHEEEIKKIERKEAEASTANLIKSPSESEIEQKVQNEMQKDLYKKQRELQDKELELKQKESKLSKRLTDKQILLIGAKFALIQKAKGKSVSEILDEKNLEDSIKAVNISFSEDDIALLTAI